MAIPFAPILGGGLSLINALMQSGDRRAATNLGYQNLYETRRSNRRQEDEQRRVNDLIEQLQKASREDPLGNVMSFDEGLNRFETDLTPITEAILGSQQTEQLRQLREDAPRNRAAAERMDRRSRLSDEAFEEALREYRFRPQRSEEASISDATQELLGARREGIRDAEGDIITTLLRQGNTSAIPAVSGRIASQYGDSLADAILQGRRVGEDRFRQQEGADTSRLLQELGGLSNLAGRTTTSPVARDRTAEQLTGRSDQALNQLIQALASGGSSLASIIGQGAGRESAAVRDISRSVANSSPDLSGLARIIAGLDFGGEEEEQDLNEFPPAPPPYGVGLY